MTPCQSECYFKHWFELWPEPESPWPDVDPLPPIQLDPPVDFELPFPDYDGVIPIDTDLNPPSQFPYPDMDRPIDIPPHQDNPNGRCRIEIVPGPDGEIIFRLVCPF